jgi:hypothetical protein
MMLEFILVLVHMFIRRFKAFDSLTLFTMPMQKKSTINLLNFILEIQM